jgi:hypothetical protein
MVEVCFDSPDHEKTMRVAGVEEILDYSGLKARLMEEWPLPKAIARGADDPALVRFLDTPRRGLASLRWSST